MESGDFMRSSSVGSWGGSRIRPGVLFCFTDASGVMGLREEEEEEEDDGWERGISMLLVEEVLLIDFTSE